MTKSGPGKSEGLPDGLGAVVLDALPCALIVTNSTGETLWVNRGFSEICGYSLEEALGKKPGDLLQGTSTDRATVVRIRRALKRRERSSERILNYDKRGRSYWISLDICPYEWSGGEGFIGIARDLTQGFEERVPRGPSLDLGHFMGAVGQLAQAANEEHELHQFCLSLADALAALKRSREET